MTKKNIDLTTVGGRIKAKRLEAGMTQEQLADMLLVKGNLICGYESNKVNIPLNTLQRLAKLLSTSVSYLADGIETEHTEEEEELLTIFNSLKSDELRTVALNQLKALLSI